MEYGMVVGVDIYSTVYNSYDECFLVLDIYTVSTSLFSPDF